MTSKPLVDIRLAEVVEEILDEFAEQMKEIHAMRLEDRYYDSHGAHDDVTGAYETAKQAILKAIKERDEQRSLIYRAWIYQIYGEIDSQAWKVLQRRLK